MQKEDEELVHEGDQMAEKIHERMGLGLKPKFQDEKKKPKEDEQQSDSLKEVPMLKPDGKDQDKSTKSKKYDRFWISAGPTPKHSSGHES